MNEMKPNPALTKRKRQYPLVCRSVRDFCRTRRVFRLTHGENLHSGIKQSGLSNPPYLRWPRFRPKHPGEHRFRFPAFTLIELLVALLISAVTVTAAFEAIRMLEAVFRAYEQAASQALSLSTFQTGLHHQFMQAEEVILTPFGITLRYPEVDIRYEFETGQVRQTYLRHEHTHTKYWSLEVTETGSWRGNHPVSEGWIDRFQCTVKAGDQVETLTFRMPYCAATNMKDYAGEDPN